MKSRSLLFSLLLLLFQSSFAQFEQGPGLQQQLENAVNTLDLNQVSSGILIDKAHTLLNFSAYNGATLSDSAWTIRATFDQLYTGLNVASTTANLPLPNFSTFESSFYNNASEAPIQLSLLHFDYHRFRADALDNNLIYHEDGQFFDTPNRMDSPYTEASLFALGLSRNKSQNLSLRFDLNDNHHFTNRGSVFNIIDINFDDGQGWQSYSGEQYVSVEYAEEGLKKIQLRYNDATGNTWHSQALLSVELPAFRSHFRDFSTTPDDSIEIAEAEIFIYYNQECGDRMIRKPLIVSEGFDPNGNITYDDFYGLINQAYDLPSGQKLIDDFDDAGYDIIFVNYDKGDASVAENANHLKAVIEEVNRMKHLSGSYEPNVLIGASMGGLIGKWALRKMEDDPLVDPETRLFISFDAPLSGANIPVGFQALIKSLGDHYLGPIQMRDLGENNPLKIGWNSLTSPAARNMLYYNIGNPDGLRVWHDQFYTQFNALGDFREIEHIAISNGSQIGEAQLFEPGDCLLNKTLTANDFLKIILGESWKAIIASAEINIALATNLTFRLRMWALPGNQNNKVYEGLFTQFILGVPQASVDSYHVPTGLLPLDSAPGGMREFNNVDSGKGGFDFGWKHSSHCFIPSFSSLGLSDSQINDNLCAEGTLSGSTTQSYTGTISATFDWNGEAKQHNQEHIYLNARQAMFLVYHLVGDEELASLASLDGRTYNFGEGNPLFATCDGTVTNDPYTPRATSKDIDQNLNVMGSSQLWLNRLGRIGFVDIETNIENETGIHFPVFIRKKCDQANTVTVANGGILHLGEGSNTTSLTIESENTLWIDNGGKLLIEEGSQIVVQTGATLIIGDNANLSAGANTKILVEPGGLLRIGNRSTINLEQTSSMIHVAGQLHWQGNFDFPGYGYFKFAREHKLLLDSDFELEGRSKGIKFIELEKDTRLEIGSRNLTLRDGAVVYGSESSINIGAGAQASLWSSEFSGAGIGLWAVEAEKITVRDCSFSRLEAGIRAEQMSGPSQTVSFLLSDFQSCTQGIIAYHCNQLFVNSCNFVGGSNSLDGLYLESVNHIDFTESEVTNFDLPIANGIQMIDVGSFNMSGGNILNCTYGIYCPDFSAAGLSSANIFLSGQATLEDNDYGIYLAKGSAGHGLVSMNCARLINNNVVGISGVDIDLIIDACQHANSPDCRASIRPNHFEGGHGSPIGPGWYFDICYEDKLVTEIAARGNYWAWGANPNGYKYRLGNSGGNVCNGVRLDDTYKQQEAPTDCDGSNSPSEPGDIEIGPQIGSNQDQWLPPGLSADRQQVIDNYQGGLRLFPNPSTTQLQIFLAAGTYQVSIHDVQGKVVWAKEVVQTARLEVSEWTSGLYIIQATDKTTGVMLHQKLIVE